MKLNRATAGIHSYVNERQNVSSVLLRMSLLIVLWFCVLVSGNISYTLHRESNPSSDQLSAYEKIETAMDSALGYYNTLTTITKSLNVYYNTGVQTADANFNGTVRFGPDRAYMVVHTAMHETAHTVGVGTCNEYWNLLQDGVFTGSRATAMLREITGDPDTVLHGDQQHFWPYGLNYANEVKSEQDLINHCRMVNAIYMDMFGAEEFYRACTAGTAADTSGSSSILMIRSRRTARSE